MSSTKQTTIPVKKTAPKKVKSSEPTVESTTTVKTTAVKSTPAPVIVEKEELLEEDSVDVVSTIVDKRKLPTRDSVIQTFEDLIKSIEVELESLREGDSKNKGIKFLRLLNKKLKHLKNQSSRIIKQKKAPTKKNNNTNSGFLKPVQISGEMAKFTGWPQNELKSRVDVTKYLCQYIRENNLQNPSDKRQIIADSKLQKLLKLDPKKDTEPLTYFRLQTQLKSHFVKPEVVA